MSKCDSFCAGQLPPIGFDACKTEPRPGGISHLLFKTCDVCVPSDPVVGGTVQINEAAWRPLFEQCKLRLSPELLGSKGEASTTDQRLSSCRPERAIGGTQTIEFRDYSSSENLSDYDFWQTIQKDQSSLQVGWFTCDGLFYGFFGFSVNISEIIEDSNEGTSYKQGTITIPDFRLVKPVRIDGLISLASEYISYDCNTGSYLQDGPPSTASSDFYGCADPGPCEQCIQNVPISFNRSLPDDLILTAQIDSVSVPTCADWTSVSINWGDGSPLFVYSPISAPPFNFAHTYATYGPYNLIFTFTDTEGCSRVQSYNILISDLDPIDCTTCPEDTGIFGPNNPYLVHVDYSNPAPLTVDLNIAYCNNPLCPPISEIVLSSTSDLVGPNPVSIPFTCTGGVITYPMEFTSTGIKNYTVAFTLGDPLAGCTRTVNRSFVLPAPPPPSPCPEPCASADIVDWDNGTINVPVNIRLLSYDTSSCGGINYWEINDGNGNTYIVNESDRDPVTGELSQNLVYSVAGVWNASVRAYTNNGCYIDNVLPILIDPPVSPVECTICGPSISPSTNVSGNTFTLGLFRTFPNPGGCSSPSSVTVDFGDGSPILTVLPADFGWVGPGISFFSTSKIYALANTYNVIIRYNYVSLDPVTFQPVPCVKTFNRVVVIENSEPNVCCNSEAIAPIAVVTEDISGDLNFTVSFFFDRYILQQCSAQGVWTMNFLGGTVLLPNPEFASGSTLVTSNLASSAWQPFALSNSTREVAEVRVSYPKIGSFIASFNLNRPDGLSCGPDELNFSLPIDRLTLPNKADYCANFGTSPSACNINMGGFGFIEFRRASSLSTDKRIVAEYDAAQFYSCLGDPISYEYRIFVSLPAPGSVITSYRNVPPAPHSGRVKLYTGLLNDALDPWPPSTTLTLEIRKFYRVAIPPSFGRTEIEIPLCIVSTSYMVPSPETLAVTS